MASNQATLTTFLTAVGNQDLTTLMTQFCNDDVSGAYPIPCVAVTDHIVVNGPGFFGTKKITKLFKRLFAAFPDVTLTPLTPANPLFLTSADNATIGLQTTLKGTQQDWWFPPGDSDKFYSKPLSDIPPNGVAVSIPATCVFTFNSATNKINQLAVYMDRYKFIKILAPNMETNLVSLSLPLDQSRSKFDERFRE
jgi:hypothetical protein